MSKERAYRFSFKTKTDVSFLQLLIAYKECFWYYVLDTEAPRVLT